MKFKLTILFLLLSGCIAISNSQNLFTDDFEYPERDSLEGIGGWQRFGANSIYNVKVAAPGLTYNDYPGSGTGNSVYFTNTPNGDIVHHVFPTQTSGSLFMAFMIKVEYLGFTATEGFNICFDAAEGQTSATAMLFVKKVSSTHFQLGIAKSSYDPVYESTPYSIGHTYLVVVKYMFLSGAGNDRVKMFAFYSGVPASEPANANTESTFGDDRLNIGEIMLSNAYSHTGLNQTRVKIDGIRVGTSWQDALPLAVNQTSTEVPEGYSLSQNYPNPFNPITNINFSVPESQHVRITVKDILGKQVASLVDEKLNPGIYSTNWDASNFPSGVYFYRLEAGKFTEVRKMILVK